MQRFSLLAALTASIVFAGFSCNADPVMGTEPDSVAITNNDKAAEAQAVDPDGTPVDFQKETLANPYTNSYAQMNAINKAAPGANSAAQIPESETGKVDKEAKLISPADAKKKVAALVRAKMAKTKATEQASDVKPTPQPARRAEDSLLTK